MTRNKVSEHIERLVNLIKGQEPAHDFDEEDVVEADNIVLQNDADDEDGRIEEV